MTSVILLDVGHGNCSIVRTTDATAVIDCPTGALLLDTLLDLGIDKIEAAIISHADKDHLAGILSLLTSDRVRVKRVFVNPDGQKRTRIWHDFLVAVAIAERKGNFEVVTSLSSTTPGKIPVGDAEISILCPSAALALSGVGGKAPQTNGTVTSNTLSAVLRVTAGSAGAILLAADMDETCLNEAIASGINLAADVLVFPHHGGLPGNANAAAFTNRLLAAVSPQAVVFSNGRGRHDAPRQEIIAAVRARNCSISCTQLSKRCHATEVNAEPYLEDLRASGRTFGASCAGSMTFSMSPTVARNAQATQRHHAFVSERVSTPMCR